MPNPGQANNPGGNNAYASDGVEEPYGAIQRRKELTAMAPAGSQAVAAALNAPKRNQRHATKGVTRQVVDAPAQPAPPQEQPQANPLVQFWTDLASDPGASDLVRSYAKVVTSG